MRGRSQSPQSRVNVSYFLEKDVRHVAPWRAGVAIPSKSGHHSLHNNNDRPCDGACPYAVSIPSNRVITLYNDRGRRRHDPCSPSQSPQSRVITLYLVIGFFVGMSSFCLLSQSPQSRVITLYGLIVVGISRITGIIVSIPSNRVNLSYDDEALAGKRSFQSQSPQIGSMFLTQEGEQLRSKHVEGILSQSPQIGSMFLTRCCGSNC